MEVRRKKAHMIKGIIFDLDGTTLDTLQDIAESFNRTLKEFGYKEKSVDEIRMGVGKGFRVLTEKMLPQDTDEKTRETIALRYRQIYSQNYYKNTRPYEGMSEVLTKLQEEGIRMAVHSNKSDIFVKDLIARNYPGIAFIEVCGALEGVPMKPDAGGVFRILDRMKLSKEEVLYVGDSETDMKTAYNADVRPVGVLWGFRDEKTLKENGADLIIKDPKELLNIIKEEL
ncbi:MAG: HAD family hydrolase [Erysipelotrichaceae bacterium]|nr:HAD family hydrolase [Erysipelotrichaceae bacterium]